MVRDTEEKKKLTRCTIASIIVPFAVMDDFSKKIGISFYGITINGVPIAKSVNYQ